MKKYKASDLSHKRAEVMKEARNGGVIIQECRTNGEVVFEYIIHPFFEDGDFLSLLWIVDDKLPNDKYDPIRLEGCSSEQ